MSRVGYTDMHKKIEVRFIDGVIGGVAQLVRAAES
jgi:hypothetical protein